MKSESERTDKTKSAVKFDGAKLAISFPPFGTAYLILAKIPLNLKDLHRALAHMLYVASFVFKFPDLFSG